VVYGGIIELSRRPFGSLTFALQGNDSEIDEALAGLRALTDVTEHAVKEGV
jgi:D-methionine transport system ATP-binding protein